MRDVNDASSTIVVICGTGKTQCAHPADEASPGTIRSKFALRTR